MKKITLQTLITLGLIIFASNTTHASTTQIRSHIRAVRIIVVDKNNTITQIYRNSTQDIAPDVRLLTPDGSRLSYTWSIAQQYGAIEPSLSKDSIGKVYDDSKLPSLIETLYAML